MNITKTHEITMYGAAWCGDCRRSKRLLDTLGIEYTYVNLDDEPNRAEEAKAISGRTQIPVITFTDGTFQVEPSDRDLSAKLTQLQLL